MSATGRNQPCPCGSGKKAKRCCGTTRGPSNTELAKAFLAARSQESAIRLMREGLDDIGEVFDAMLDLPGQHLSLQLPLPRLLSPVLDALRLVIERNDDASDSLVDAALAEVDSPDLRATLLQILDGLVASGAVDGSVADAVAVDLHGESSSFMRMSLLYTLSVSVGATRTPSGLVVSTRPDGRRLGAMTSAQ